MRLPAPTLLALSLSLTSAALPACRGAPKSALGPAAQRYTVRGELIRISDAPDGRSFFIRHEAIPGFVDRAGAKVGMASMTMPFKAGPSAAGAPVKPGDKIQFRFGVDWERNATEVESIEPLPADTALVFGK
jgi:Cu/Ag efflux protein CusF